MFVNRVVRGRRHDGDIGRFAEVVEGHKDRLFGFALYYLGDRHQAEDVVQEVLLKLWRNWHKLDGADLPAWLTTVTRNASYDVLRARKRTSLRLVELDATEVSATDDRPDPAHRAASSELGRRLEAAVRELEEPYRTIVLLREVQGRPHQEIAQALSMPVSTVKVYAHRARKRLRQSLGEDLGHDA